MTLQTTKLRQAITFALAAGVTTIGATGAAFAQQPVAPANQPDATTLDRIQVTGSRIRQVDLETQQPVTFITREDIDKQGFQSVADILQNISAVGTPPISRASPLSSGEAAGGTFISLRNLGAPRTLVLINGRRLGITTGGLADISTIPASAVERIEILKDGASSIYGSDAISGVVNIITRTNFEGAQASAYYGQYSEGDGDITKGDFVLGFTGDRGSVTVAAEWTREEVVKAADRPFSAFPRSSNHPNDNWTVVGQFGGFAPSRSQAGLFTNVTFPAPTAANPNPTTRVVLRDGGDPRNPADYRNQNTNGGGCLANSIAAPGPNICVDGSPADKSNTNQQTDLRTPLENRSLYVDGVFDITDNVRFRSNLLYSNRLSERTVAGFPLQASSPPFGGPAILAANSYFNPSGAPISNWWRRTWEQPRITTAELTTYRFSGAFEGTFEFADRVFDWDVSYLKNDSRLLQSTLGNTNITRLRQAVGPSFLNAQGVVQCGSPNVPGGPITAVPLNECRPFNPFLPFGREGQGGLTNNQPLQNFLFQQENATGRTETQVIAASVAGTIFELPAGDFGFAFGLENRKEEGSFFPDALAQTGASTNLGAAPTSGGYSLDEAYVELEIPLLSDLPFARELSINLASRYSDFDSFGSTTNNKFGLTWKPIDSLLLRATAADGFRAPTIADLFGGGSQTFSFYADPCDVQFGQTGNPAVAARCARDLGALAPTYRQLVQGLQPKGAEFSQTPIAFTSGSNPELTPELSKSQTIGLVYSPSFVEGLNVALDWWKVRIDDTIVGDAPTTILNDCYVQGIASRCVASVDGRPGFSRDPGNGIPLVIFANRNAGFRKAEGYDFDISYRWTTENFGRFTAVSNSTYTAKDFFVSTDDPTFATSGVSFNSQFRIRSNLNVGWDYGSFGASWTTRYFSAIKEGCAYVTPQLPNTAANRPNRAPPVTESHLECNEIVDAPNGSFRADGSPDSALSRRNRTGATVFNDVQVRYQTPWNATVAVGANNVFEKLGPVLYNQPSANVSYYGGFDIGRFLYMRYTQRF